MLTALVALIRNVPLKCEILFHIAFLSLPLFNIYNEPIKWGLSEFSPAGQESLAGDGKE